MSMQLNFPTASTAVQFLWPLQSHEFFFIFYLFSRASGFFLSAPLFSLSTIPNLVKVFLGLTLAILMAFILYPTYSKSEIHRLFDFPLNQFQTTSIHLLIIAIKELFVGYMLGLCFAFALEAMHLAGEVIDNMMGFGAANFVDPFSNNFQSLLSQLLILMGVLIMLLIDFHHVLIRMWVYSFKVIPLGFGSLTQEVWQLFAALGLLIFIYGVRIASVSIIVLIGGLVGIAFTIRVVPEMNLLRTGLPMRILIGFITLFVGLSAMPLNFQELLKELTYDAYQLLHLLNPT